MKLSSASPPVGQEEGDQLESAEVRRARMERVALRRLELLSKEEPRKI